jgi:hypothetical protein
MLELLLLRGLIKRHLALLSLKRNLYVSVLLEFLQMLHPLPELQPECLKYGMR